ncbi:MAG: DNA alkylation repair protein [Deltaproteobacteria bacterium]|nr:DNA alkylation repair protein [Deltaproteobacteria bacterium]MBK05286.1 DNA alkylation repair protein [Deltaproteobacteria bacterium]
MKAETSFSLADQLFHKEKVVYLASRFKAVYPRFSQKKFEQEVLASFPDLGLKQRISHITACLKEYLPKRYPTALSLLIEVLPERLDPDKTDDDFGDFIFAPLSLYVARYGCTKKHLEASLLGLKEITMRFSAEEAIRFFINAFPEETLDFLMECARDDHYHVRRLASEGTRPTLPWAQKLVIDWETPLPILEQLYGDSTRFVTRSVANHLNDISKISPESVVDLLTEWQGSEKQNEKELGFITRHSLRTLEKKGHKGALSLLGFDGHPDVTISGLKTNTPEVVVGDAFVFECTITSNKSQSLLIDYVMEFATERKRVSKKVFKWKKIQMEEGDCLTLKKRHPMKLMTTRRLVAGEHTITLQINGESFDSISFELLEPPK